MKDSRAQGFRGSSEVLKNYKAMIKSLENEHLIALDPWDPFPN
jgi:hypothetical protein